MYGEFKEYLQQELKQIHSEGLYKNERILKTPQGVEIKTVKGLNVLG